MRKYIYALIFLICVDRCSAQTLLPATTTIQQFSNLPKGVYQFAPTADSMVTFTKDTLISFIKVIHDTVKILLPCPVVKQRSVSALNETIIGSKRTITITYDTGEVVTWP